MQPTPALAELPAVRLGEVKLEQNGFRMLLAQRLHRLHSTFGARLLKAFENRLCRRSRSRQGGRHCGSEPIPFRSSKPAADLCRRRSLSLVPPWACSMYFWLSPRNVHFGERSMFFNGWKRLDRAQHRVPWWWHRCGARHAVQTSLSASGREDWHDARRNAVPDTSSMSRNMCARAGVVETRGLPDCSSLVHGSVSHHQCHRCASPNLLLRTADVLVLSW